MNLYIDVHALQTLPPSNINRDDTGAPKTATFGGVPRQRVSSQAWKRATRRDFEDYLDRQKLGLRTKRVVSLVAAEIQKLGGIDGDVELATAEAAAEEVLKATGLKIEKPKVKKDAKEEARTAGETGYLLFLGRRQIHNIAEAIVNARGEKIGKAEAKKLVDTEHSVDIAMFGRMVADAPDFNVDAAVQVAHAIGVDAAEPEFDYFTAVDDVAREAEESGAGMIGTVEMMSSTLYRYATINVDQLRKNLGTDAATVEAATAFVRSFVNSMPTGKQNTFANRTRPDAVVVSVRTDRPVSLVNAFEAPVVAEGQSGRRRVAAQRLNQESKTLDEMYDAKPRASWVMALPDFAAMLTDMGEAVNQTQLLEALESTLVQFDRENS